ncbi:MAG: HAMP domain-containing histidine kinase [Desulfobacterales bacterium]|nr:HAMP domain-containing histidine kinase [Desulfobacterales bacterium]
MVADISPDIILLDVMMPGIDGFEVCKRIKSNEKTRIIPIVMVTALTEKEARIKAIKAGADEFLSKPLDRTELLVRIKSLLRIKSYHDELLDSYKEITEKNEKLSEMERIKGGLIHMIIHDLNNPLHAISISLEMVLMEKEKLTKKQFKRLNECLYNCMDLEALIQSILDINKMEEGKLEPAKELIDLFELTDCVLTEFMQIIKAREISLFFSRRKDIPRINIDPNLIKRVIANLINNAITHTSVGGKIEIRIDYHSERETICFTIKDNGVGIKPQYHQKIFNKFEQLEVKQAGALAGRSGLGLAFCKLAIEAHQGQIWVESEGEGKGSSFSFTISV